MSTLNAKENLSEQLHRLESGTTIASPFTLGLDEKGADLLRKLTSAQETVRDLKAQLAQHVASQGVEQGPRVERDEESEETRHDHHESFTRAEQRHFFGLLSKLCKRLGWDSKVAHEMAENVWRRKRVSAMTCAERSGYLAWLEGESGQQAYELEARCASHRGAVERAQAPQQMVWKSVAAEQVECFNCGLLYYPLEKSCPHCGSRVTVERAA